MGIDLKKLEILSGGWGSFLKFRDRRLDGINTGINALDRVLLGLSGVTIAQAAPGSGKSTLALQIAWQQVKQGYPVFVFDRENGRERTRMRLLCVENDVSQVDVLTAQKPRLETLVQTVSTPLFHYSNSLKSPDQLEEIVAAIHEKHQKRMFVVIDSLQKLPPLNDSERLSIDRWLLFFDQLKLQYENQLVIFCTSEKSRGEGGANYTEARMGSAKGSSELEFTAEILMDLRAQGNQVAVRILKNRDGAVGSEVKLQRHFVNPHDDSSFSFKFTGE